MFALRDEFKLGKVLFPKTKARSTNDDISINKILEHMIPDSKFARHELKKMFVGKKADNLKKFKLYVEVFSLTTGALLGQGVSGEITDTGSKTVGSTAVH